MAFRKLATAKKVVEYAKEIVSDICMLYGNCVG